MSALRGRLGAEARFLVLTCAAPEMKSESDTAPRAAGPSLLFDVIDVTDAQGLEQLARYGAGERAAQGGFWSPAELEAAGR